jgi:adenylate cyclase
VRIARPRIENIPRPVAAGGYAGLVCLLVLLLRWAGLFEFLELKAYDWLLAWRVEGAAADDRITVVEIDEADKEAYGFCPIPDEELAQVLERLLAHGPRVIGLDLLRDRPVEPGYARLAALLASEQRIVGGMWVPGPDYPGVPPPPAIVASDSPWRVGFLDVMPDRQDDVIRRGLLFLGGGADARWSMGLQMALHWLAPEGITIGPSGTDDPSPRLGAALLRRLPEDPVGYVREDPSGYQFLMTYPQGTTKPQTLSWRDVLAGRAAPELIRDRIVLVGSVVDVDKDYFLTPLQDEKVYGVFLHAQVASQLIRMALGEGGGLVPVPHRLDRLWILLWCAVGATLALLLHGRGVLLLAAALTAAALLKVAAGVLFYWGWWIGLVPAVIGGLLSLVMVGLHLAWLETAERRTLTRLFNVNVSSKIAEHLWAERDEFDREGRPPARKLRASVLFLDMRDSTKIAEGKDPADLVGWLNEYLARMAECVTRHGGIVDKFTGDGLMAVFGPPLRRSEAEAAADARAAVACAVDMAESLGPLNRGFAERGLSKVRIRVGVHKGEVVGGCLGSDERQQYTLIGDTVNTASRLESWKPQQGEPGYDPDYEARDCRILVSGEVLACLGPDRPAVHVAPLTLRGRTQPLEVYRVRLPTELAPVAA